MLYQSVKGVHGYSHTKSGKTASIFKEGEWEDELRKYFSQYTQLKRPKLDYKGF